MADDEQAILDKIARGRGSAREGAPAREQRRRQGGAASGAAPAGRGGRRPAGGRGREGAARPRGGGAAEGRRTRGQARRSWRTCGAALARGDGRPGRLDQAARAGAARRAAAGAARDALRHAHRRAGHRAARPHLSRRRPLELHEPELTQDEIDWGKCVRERRCRAAGDRDAEQRAWRKLSAALRAAAGRVGRRADVPDRRGRRGPPRSHRADVAPRAWTRAPRARGAAGPLGGRCGHPGGTPCADRVGRAPVSRARSRSARTPPRRSADPGDDGAALDDGMRWMVEFDEAVKTRDGPADPADRAAGPGLRPLLAVGVRWSDAPAAASRPAGRAASRRTGTRTGWRSCRHGTATNNTPRSTRASPRPTRTRSAASRSPAASRAPLPAPTAHCSARRSGCRTRRSGGWPARAAASRPTRWR